MPQDDDIYDELFSAPLGSVRLITTPYKLHATLRIYHDDLKPDELTQLFGVVPSKIQQKGLPLPKLAKYPNRADYIARTDGWFLDSSGHVISKELRSSGN